MKSKKKEEEIDLTTLPPWCPIFTSLHYNLPKQRAKIVQDRI